MLNARFYDDPLLKHIKTFSVSLITAIPINTWDKVFPSTSFAVFWYFLWLQSYIVFIRKVFALILLNSVICIYIYTFFFLLETKAFCLTTANSKIVVTSWALLSTLNVF